VDNTEADPVLRLYPPPQEEIPLEGLYLELSLHRQVPAGEILIYSNYIASLDGRISVRDEETGEFKVPGTIANKRDWRLYQELAAQSDVMITSARYFRQLAKGRTQDVLPVGREREYADLLAWRSRQGLAEQPTVAILSHSLDIPLKALDRIADRDIYVFTTDMADPGRIASLRAHGAHVVAAGERYVEGVALRRELAALGFRSAYMIAGPQVHAALLAAGVLDRLFLTQRHTLIGGDVFHTVTSGGLGKTSHMRLLSMYYDSALNPGQSFAHYTYFE